MWPTAACVGAFLFDVDAIRAEYAPRTQYNASGQPVTDAKLSAFAITQLQGAEIGRVEIVNSNIFDLTDPREDKALYRLANALHIKTRPEVIASQLLFQPGDVFQMQELEESERLLRKTRYLGDAEIQPVRIENGVVDIEVRTRDDWTLKPSFSFGRSGGQNSSSVGLEEYNLFGRGTQIGIDYRSDVDRDSLTAHYSDANLFEKHYRVAADYSRNSDGFRQRVDFSKPFYALASLRAGGIALTRGRQIESLFDLGKPVSQYEHEFEQYEAFIGRSSGLQKNSARRWLVGVSHDKHVLRHAGIMPAPEDVVFKDRRFTYPFFGLEFVEDQFVKDKNVDQIGRVEDRHMGARLSARIGYSNKELGSTADAWHVRADYRNSARPTKKSTLLYEASASGRLENGTGRNLMLSIAARFDRRQSDKRLFHARVVARIGKNLDLDNPVYIGGDNGLRGYPLRYQGGDKSLLITLEQRFFTDWYPFRLFRVGGAAFFDAGRTWGRTPAGGENLGWLQNAGVGLRIGNTRSSVGRVLHIDLAYPLKSAADISSVQLLIEAKRSF